MVLILLILLILSFVLSFVLSCPIRFRAFFADHARSPGPPPSNIIRLAILGPSTQVLPPRLLELRASLQNMFVNGYSFLLQRLERYHLGCWEEYVFRPTYRERKYLIAIIGGGIYLGKGRGG